MEKFCRACQTTKLASDFPKDRSKPDGLNAYCKACTCALQKRYRMRPPRHPAPEGLKRCTLCKETKAPSEFYPEAGQYDGLARGCKPCTAMLKDRWRRKNLSRAAATGKKWRDANPRQFKDLQLKSRYGVPVGWYEKTLAEQDGKCACCGTTTPNGAGDFHLDHCHDTNQVRGLLCHDCNIGIGYAHHSVERLQAMIRYLTFHQAQEAPKPPALPST